MTKRTCSVDGCERKHEAHGFCPMHMIRWKACGDPGEPESRRYANTATICTVVGCGGPVVRKDLCNKHALRLERHGDPLAGGRWRNLTATPQERLVSFVDSTDPDGCWIWNGALTAAGYGWVKPATDVSPVLAHRWAYELLVGTIPAGLQLDHLCHTRDETCRVRDECPHRACVNPAHLEPVTPAENNRRAHRWR